MLFQLYTKYNDKMIPSFWIIFHPLLFGIHPGKQYLCIVFRRDLQGREGKAAKDPAA